MASEAARRANSAAAVAREIGDQHSDDWVLSNLETARSALAA
jgi:hypothetical protein